MSLKAFHIFFISMSALMCFGIGVWRWVDYASGGPAGALGQAIVATVAGALLVGYGWRFLRKYRNLGYL